MISEISCYLYFPDGNWPPCWISKSIKFYMQTRSGKLTHITIPNFLETGLSKAELADILRFFKFSKWPPPPSWIFEITKFYWLFWWRGSKRISTRNFAEIGQSVETILRLFDFSRWRPSAILDSFGGIFGPPTVSSCGSVSLCKIWLWSMQ